MSELIPKTLVIAFLLIQSSIILSTTEDEKYVIGFGSCITEKREQPIWEAIKDENVDEFFFMGDNVYGDSDDGLLEKMEASYEKQKQMFPKWVFNKKLNAIWDDHDYGKNDGGGDYKNKQEAQKLFLDFWEISKNDPRRTREGIFFEETQQIEGKKIHFIGLDTRYFRSELKGKKNGYLANDDPNASVLGNEQWDWLDRTLEESKADIVIILSSIQILATNHRFEKWSNFTVDRKKLLTRIDGLMQDKKVILISGDRHRAGLYQKGNLIEITASALNKGSSRPIETDPLLLGKTYPQTNFGVLNIEPSKNIITLSINNKDGKELESKVISL